MRSDARPIGPLTQVIFVHDYIQVKFDDDIYSLYNRLEIQNASGVLRQGQDGFTDALVNLIGHAITSDSREPGAALVLLFDNQSTLRVLEGPENENGPEAYHYAAANGSIVVEQNST